MQVGVDSALGSGLKRKNLYQIVVNYSQDLYEVLDELIINVFDIVILYIHIKYY